MELVQRNIKRRLSELLKISPIVMVEGARQVGKSTLTHMLLPSENAHFLTLDDPVAASLAAEDPAVLLDGPPGGRIVIDEIQRVPELILALKMQVDNQRQAGRYVLTGSANLLRIPGSQDSLAGRAMTLRLHPFSQGELLGKTEDWVSTIVNLASGEAVRLAEIPPAAPREEIVLKAARGGYPPVQNFADSERHLWLKDYLKRLLQRDATDLGQLNTQTLERLFRLLAANAGAELVLQHLADQLGASRETVRRYLDLLDAMFLTLKLPAWSRNLSKRQVRRPKLYLSDPGLFTATQNLRVEHLLSPQGFDYLGPLVEGFVVGELSRQATWSATPFELYYYRDRSGAEVDIIIETPQGVIAIEVKAATTLIPRHYKHLTALRDQLGDQFLAGIVLNLAEPRMAGRKIYSLPINSLWESPGTSDSHESTNQG